MFDVSWGEIFVVTGLSISIVGRKDLPKVSYFLGSKIGQVVGLLQGTRARADQFATNHELKALQNELRSGLRELDSVKSEFAVAASSRGLVGRGLGSTVGRGVGAGAGAMNGVGMNRIPTPQSNLLPSKGNPSLLSPSPSSSPNSIPTNSDYLAAAREANNTNQSSEVFKPLNQLPPRSQSVAAVAEEEWEKQGIGFKSRAEMGTGSYALSPEGVGVGNGNGNMSGSFLLSDLMQQSLIHDQYDRAVLEQDEIIKSKVERAKRQAKTQKVDANTPKS